jgi:hypothetical protein
MRISGNWTMFYFTKITLEKVNQTGEGIFPTTLHGRFIR